MNSTSTPPATGAIKKALLESTIVLDWLKMEARREVIEELLRGYGWRYTTSIALLEFKATIIEACIFLYNAFRETPHFSRVRDRVTESRHRQTALRLHIIHNMLQVCEDVPRSMTNREEVMAELAAEQLETIIPELYDWFRSTAHVDQVLWDRIDCTRATERPAKKTVRFETNLPNCKRGRNKRCKIETALRDHSATIVATITPHATPVGDENPNQFRRALDVIEIVTTDLRADLSHNDCRKAGDCLIALESFGHATHALSTNRAEWEIVAPMMGMEFVHVVYPSTS